jgi:hypothetical protein
MRRFFASSDVSPVAVDLKLPSNSVTGTLQKGFEVESIIVVIIYMQVNETGAMV